MFFPDFVVLGWRPSRSSAMRPFIWPETLDAIVSHYRRDDKARAREAIWWRADGLPFSAVVDRIARAQTDSGARHPHQRRLTEAAIVGCVDALNATFPQIRSAKDFFEVFVIVEQAFAGVFGAGELAVYDATDRLCHHLGHTPTLVYLHNGTRIGARRLKGGRLRREGAWAMHHDELPNALRTLTPREAEDVLCIYKDRFLDPPGAIDDLLHDVRETCVPGTNVRRAC